MTVTLAALSVALGLGWNGAALADPPDTAGLKSTSGIATKVDAADRIVAAKGFWGSRDYNIANDCRFSLPGNPSAALSDLRPGQKLEIYYANASGVPVAHLIQQAPMTYVGHVRDLDAQNHTMVVTGEGREMTFKLPDDVRIALRNDKLGTLANIQAGDRVTVTYEEPADGKTARNIEQTSETFSGSVTAIDTDTQTLKAKAMFGVKKFNLANDCQIVIDGKAGGSLKNLRIGEPVVLDYDDNSGVLVVNRIGNSPAKSDSPMVNNQANAAPTMPQ